MPSEWKLHRNRLAASEKRLSDVYAALAIVESAYRDTHPPFAAAVEESQRVVLQLGRTLVQLKELLIILPASSRMPKPPPPPPDYTDESPDPLG